MLEHEKSLAKWLLNKRNRSATEWKFVGFPAGYLARVLSKVYDVLNDLGDDAVWFSKLNSVDCSKCPWLNNDDLASIVAILASSEAENLSIDLYHCERITDPGLEHLSRLKNLTILDLRGCDRITDKGLLDLFRNHDSKLHIINS
jgi:hypothetical protein